MARDPAKAKASNGSLLWRILGKDRPIMDPLDIDIIDGKVVRGASNISTPPPSQLVNLEPPTPSPDYLEPPPPRIEVPVLPDPEPVAQQPANPTITPPVEVPETPLIATPLLSEPFSPPLPDDEPEAVPERSRGVFSETVAAASVALLQSTAQKKSRSPSEEADRNFRFRLPPGLKKQFRDKCDANGQDMSKVIVNLIRAYVAVLLIAVSIFAVPSSSKYTTNDIVSYCCDNCGFSWIEKFPVTAALGLRSALTDAGTGTDTAALFYGRHRVEVAVSVPLWSASGSRQLKQQKAEFVSSILRDLAGLCNQEKLTATLEAQVRALTEVNKRVASRVESGQSNQTELGKSALDLTTAQIKLHEARAKLDEFVMALASRAGEQWQKARNMVLAWDRKLYD